MSGVEFIVQVGAASGFRWLEIGDEPVLFLGVGDDGVLWWNVVHGGETLEDVEIVEGVRQRWLAGSRRARGCCRVEGFQILS